MKKSRRLADGGALALDDERGGLLASARMPTDIPLRCACGTIRGTALAVAPGAGNHVVCYCKDCQAFARFLGRPGITDEQGGTDIFQMAPGRVRITAGAEALACVRLSDKGLHRWYCRDCKTPLGNTVSARVPFVGLIHSFMDPASDGPARAAALGRPIVHAFPEGATGPLPRFPGDISMPRFFARAARLMLTWLVTGVASPSPFFAGKGAPRCAPQVLTPEQRRAL